MVSDQRFASRRPDVLVYQTDPLPQDITLAGPVAPRLHVSTSGTDSDFVVKLVDVYPPDYEEEKPEEKRPADVPPPADTTDGYQQLVRGEPMRGKFRHGFEHPEPFIPGKVEQVDFTMPDVNHTFRRGHRIMVQVQSSWFPLFDRNPQSFVPSIYDAKASDFTSATERISTAKSSASAIDLPVLIPAPPEHRETLRE
jgi:uncharacterized protein